MEILLLIIFSIVVTGLGLNLVLSGLALDSKAALYAGITLQLLTPVGNSIGLYLLHPPVALKAIIFCAVWYIISFCILVKRLLAHMHEPFVQTQVQESQKLYDHLMKEAKPLHSFLEDEAHQKWRRHARQGAVAILQRALIINAPYILFLW